MTSWKLHPPPFFFCPAVGPVTRLAWESPFWKLAYVSLPCFSWQVSDWGSLDMHKRRVGGKRWEALRPRRAYTRLHSSPPISPPLLTPRLTQPECFCNWRPVKSKQHYVMSFGILILCHFVLLTLNKYPPDICHRKHCAWRKYIK